METKYSNEDLLKLIADLFSRYHSTHLHPHRCELFKKILELVDIQIARAKEQPDTPVIK